MRNFTSPLLLVLTLATLFTGCGRTFYRRQADRDVYHLVSEKANHPHWDLDGRFSIAIDPRSRMFDPFCADCPPMPPDDPVSHELMHCVDNKRGWPFWHDNGDTPNIENAAWPAYLEFNKRGMVVLDANDAVRVALLNSTDYQQNLEELYLSALDVSFERFRFDVQGFGGYEVFFTADGPRRSGNQSRSILEANTRNVSLQKMFSTGSELAVGFANQLVWQFSGPDDYSANTLIDFTLFQPLLRNAGRDRVLETLTLSERGLLANVRAMEQYRQGFYLSIITGRDAGGGPSRRGGVVGSGLEGFTGVGGGGFGGLGGGGGGGGAGGFGGGATPQVGGFIGLLQDQQQIRNQEDNVERLRNSLGRLEQQFVELRTRSGEPGLIDNILRQDLQVAQSRQALLSAESALITQRNAYQATLDSFKSTLGLPPQVCVEISDPMLDQFQLIDRATMEQQRALDRIIADFGAVRLRIVKHVSTQVVPDPADPMRTRVVRVLAWYPELAQDLADLKDKIEPLRQVRGKLMAEYLPTIEADIDRFEASLPRRKDWLTKLQARIEAERNDPCPLLPIPEVDPDIFRTARLDESLDYSKSQLSALSEKIGAQYEAHLNERAERIDNVLAMGETWTPERLFQELYEGVLYPKLSPAPGAAAQISDILVELPADILALQLVQARARSEAVELTAIDIKAEQALDVARKYRRDWMNARAALVDAWRLIQFNADQLQSDLNIFFSGDIGNLNPNQPFSLGSDRGRLRVGAQFDAPITRLRERNFYRQSLIEYQQARRRYYEFEDNVATTLRGTLRTALTNQLNFEFQRQAVLIAAQQIDRNQDIATNSELSNQGAGATAARDAVSALSDLLSAQNSFLGFWASYEALRRGLDLDLGTMQLDGEGLWIDPGTIGEDYGQFDPWLWRTGGADCPLPQAQEVMPAELLPGHRAHTEELPLTGESSLGPHSRHDPPQLEGLPGVKGLPVRPSDPAPSPESLLPPPLP